MNFDGTIVVQRVKLTGTTRWGSLDWGSGGQRREGGEVEVEERGREVG